jgi:hypothetical protein
VISNGGGELLSTLSLNARLSHFSIDQVGSSPPTTTSPISNGTSVDSLATPNINDTQTTSIPKTTNLENDTDTQNPNDDVAMTDGTGNNVEEALPTSEVNENLPEWLGTMIDYLRGISTEKSWQTLITEFVLFEKSGPPSGVCSEVLVC